MLELCPSLRDATSVSWTLVAVGGKLSVLVENRPCQIPGPMPDSVIVLVPVPIVIRWTLVVVIALTWIVAFPDSTVGESVA